MNTIRKNRFNFAFPALIVVSTIVFGSVCFAQEDESEEITRGEIIVSETETTEDPVKLFNQGQDAHAKGDLQKALELYSKAIEAAKEFPEAEYQIGTIYQTLGKEKEAESSFRRAMELRRDWTLPIAELGAMLVRRGDFIEAESLLNKAIRLNRMSFPAYVALSELKIKTKASDEDLKTHLAKLQYLTSKAKIPASVWASRGAIERILGKNEAAKQSIKRAFLIDKNNASAIVESVELSLLDGDSKGAVENSRRLLKLYPNSTNAKLLLARSFHQDGNFDDALKTLDTIKKPNSDVIAFRASLKASGNNDIVSLEKVLETDAKNIVALARLCILSRIPNPKKALEYCRRASQLEPTEIEHAIGFGAVLVRLKRYPEAAGLLRRLLENSPENYTIRANLATALFQMKRFEEAKIQYEWITQKQPEIAAGYYFLAISHDRLKEYLDAMANYQRFMQLANDDLKIEVERVKLRLPSLQKQIKKGKGRKRK